MKRYFYLLALSLLLAIGVTACSKNESAPVTDDSESQNIQIETPYGNLSYPKKYEDYLKTEETNDDNGYRLAFSTDIDGQSYALFTVVIDGQENGVHIGKLKDKEVYVEVSDLGDLSGLSQDKQDQIYGMQEALNDLLETK